MKTNLKIKGLKTWATEDGGGYQFNLYLNTKKVAWVHNAGDGGEMQIDWFDKNAEKAITDYVKALPPYESCGFQHQQTVGILMDDLVTEYEWEKKLARYRKKGILFRFLSDPKDSFRTLQTLDMAKAKEYLDSKHPNNYVLI